MATGWQRAFAASSRKNRALGMQLQREKEINMKETTPKSRVCPRCHTRNGIKAKQCKTCGYQLG